MLILWRLWAVFKITTTMLELVPRILSSCAVNESKNLSTRPSSDDCIRMYLWQQRQGVCMREIFMDAYLLCWGKFLCMWPKESKNQTAVMRFLKFYFLHNTEMILRHRFALQFRRGPSRHVEGLKDSRQWWNQWVRWGNSCLQFGFSAHFVNMFSFRYHY